MRMETLGRNHFKAVINGSRAYVPQLSACRDRLVRLFWPIVVALLAAAVVMRLYRLGLPSDNYDEGVYWQSLHAMNAGYGLYDDVFSAQPPFFLLSTFPTFALCGGTLWSARLGIALVSLIGLPGAFLLGRALGGRAGALAALALVIVNPYYLTESRTIEADASCAAFELLAIGLALYWWKYPLGRRGIVLGTLTGVATALSILCKLVAFPLLVPIMMLMVGRLWLRPPGGKRPFISSIAGIGAFAITGAMLLLPFAGAFHAGVVDVITMHIRAEGQFSHAGNLTTIGKSLEPLLKLAAGYGCLASLLRRDWRVLPLLAWLLAAVFLLWQQTPLLWHQLVSLVPPLVALAVMGFAPPSPASQPLPRPFALALERTTAVAAALLLLALVTGLRQDVIYYRAAQHQAFDRYSQSVARVATDLREAISPDQQVVTDAQFVTMRAGRTTPPGLVDTSGVRILTHTLSLMQLEAITSQPKVHAVLFFPDRDGAQRFNSPPVAGFHSWVAQRFHLLDDYGSGGQLWMR